MVLPTLARAGMEMVTANLASAMAERGHAVSVVCIEESGPLALELEARGVAVDLVPAPGLTSNLWAPALVSWLAGNRPDVVHTHSGAWLKGARAARAAQVPAVVHSVHGILDREPWYSNILKRWAARATSAVVSVSEPLREYLVTTARLSASGIRTIPNGVDTRMYSPESPSLRNQLVPRNEGRVVVGCVARFEPVKNHALLLRAFQRAQAERPELFLVLVGDGSLRSDAQALADSLGITDSVHFAGEQGDPASWYRSFDVFVLASRAEGLSMSILEAMASGCSVIATDVGGNAALLGPDGRAGLLVPSDDLGTLATAIVRVGSSSPLRTHLGTNARARVLELYGQDRMVDRYEAVYREVLASTRVAVG